MKSIAYITGYTFGTAKSLISRIPHPNVNKMKADFNQAIADQQAPKPHHPTSISELTVSQLVSTLEEYDPQSADALKSLIGVAK